MIVILPAGIRSSGACQPIFSLLSFSADQIWRSMIKVLDMFCFIGFPGESS